MISSECEYVSHVKQLKMVIFLSFFKLTLLIDKNRLVSDMNKAQPHRLIAVISSSLIEQLKIAMPLIIFNRLKIPLEFQVNAAHPIEPLIACN